MRIIVSSHRLEIGGSQTNAIDLAAAVRDLGHDVVLHAVDGPAAVLAQRRQLRLVPAPPAPRHPSARSVRALGDLVRTHRADLVHAYEWPQCLDAYYGPHLRSRLPVVFTVLSMTVPSWLPGRPPLIMGTRLLQQEQRRHRPGPVALLEPPVDTDADHPGAVDATAFRRRHGLDDSRCTVVIVSRLVEALKLEGILRTIDSVAVLASTVPVRLVVVGGGTAFDTVANRAAAVNARHGEGTVIMTGQETDPRPAYAAADIVVGMGSSALRAMAFAKPVVVVGELGFSLMLTPETSDVFLWGGFYGTGDGRPGPDHLAVQLRDLVTHPDRRAELGAFGQHLVADRFSLRAAARALESIYRDALARPSRRRQLTEMVPNAAHLAFSQFVPVPAKQWLKGRLPGSWQPERPALAPPAPGQAA